MTLSTLPAAATGDLLSHAVGWPTDRDCDQLTDAELVRSFLSQRNEQAFAQIVRRHGPMVLKTCRRIVGQDHDADDAFQATFMVLARKADAIRPASMLGPWLHGVACRCGMAWRARMLRNRQREQSLPEGVTVESPTAEARDWVQYLDREIERLPAIYRQPVVLCELQGRSRQEAARLLGLAEGTLSSRLATARKRLAKRLAPRGLVSVMALGSWLAMNETSSAALPDALVVSTTQRGMSLVCGSVTAALAPNVALLTQGAMQAMFMTQCKTFALVAASVGCLSFGCWFIGDVAANDPLPLTSQVTAGDEQVPAIIEQDKDPKHKKHDHSTHETIVGSGKIVTATRNVSNFQAIQLLNAGKLTIKQTGKEKLTLRTDDNLLPHLLAEVDNQVLVLKNDKEVNLKPSKDNDYTIEVKALGRLEIKGAGTITVQDLDGGKFEVQVYGAGTVTLEGKTGSLNIQLNGAGTVNTEKLQAGQAIVSIPGSGSVKVRASESLEATINGAGSIQYAGNPQVKKTIRGVGSVTKLPEGGTK